MPCCRYHITTYCFSHKIVIRVLSTQPLVPFIYNRPTPVMDILAVQRRWGTVFPSELGHSWAGLGGRFLCIIIIIPWTDLFVVEQDGVPFGKSFQYPCGSLHW